MKNHTPHQATLFAIEGHTASRAIIRESSKNSDHLRKMDLDKIRIRPGKVFNPRTRTKPADMPEELWEQVIMIPDLADKIFADGGPATPIIGDIHEDGFFYITDGERRFRALRLLLNTDRTYYNNNDSTPVREVTVMLNPPGTTDIERKKKAIAANNNLPLSTMQLAYHYLSFKEEDGMSHEQIAEECKVSRQTIDNYILAATELPKQVQEAIDSGEIKITNALAEHRKAKADKKKKDSGSGEDEPIITGKKADELEKDAKEKEKLRGDEGDFDQQDNSKTFAGSKNIPEDHSSGAIVLGKDAIYMQKEAKLRFKQFLNRHAVLFDGARALILADKPEDEEDEERAAILYEKREAHVIERLMMEYDIVVK